MKYLVDTHVLLWSFFEPEKLPTNVRAILLDSNNDIYYSPISLWEISIKYGLKKLFLNGLTPEDFYRELSDSFFLRQEVDALTIATVYKLPILHKDPFDRFLIWEAIQSDFVLLSVDGSVAKYSQEGLKVVFD